RPQPSQTPLAIGPLLFRGGEQGGQHRPHDTRWNRHPLRVVVCALEYLNLLLQPLSLLLGERETGGYPIESPSHATARLRVLRLRHFVRRAEFVEALVGVRFERDCLRKLLVSLRKLVSEGGEFRLHRQNIFYS